MRDVANKSHSRRSATGHGSSFRDSLALRLQRIAGRNSNPQVSRLFLQRQIREQATNTRFVW